MSVTGVEKGSGTGSGTERLCRLLGTESEKGEEVVEEVVEEEEEQEEEEREEEEEEGGVEVEQVEEVEERIWGVFRC